MKFTWALPAVLLLTISSVARSEDAAPATTATETAGTKSSVTTCTLGKTTRTVSISTEQKDKETICKVEYAKTTENPGVVQTLWDSHKPEFCTAKHAGFVEKLKGLGWDCQAK